MSGWLFCLSLGNFNQMKGRPIDGMAEMRIRLKFSLHLAQGLPRWGLRKVKLVEAFHETASCVIIHAPKRGEQGTGAGQEKRTT